MSIFKKASSVYFKPCLSVNFLIHPKKIKKESEFLNSARSLCILNLNKKKKKKKETIKATFQSSFQRFSIFACFFAPTTLAFPLPLTVYSRALLFLMCLRGRLFLNSSVRHAWWRILPSRIQRRGVKTSHDTLILSHPLSRTKTETITKFQLRFLGQTRPSGALVFQGLTLYLGS